MPGRGQYHRRKRGMYLKEYSDKAVSPLQAERLRRGLTQAQAAELLGINRSLYAGYESGARRWPLRWGKSQGNYAKLTEFLAAGPYTELTLLVPRAAIVQAVRHGQ